MPFGQEISLSFVFQGFLLRARFGSSYGECGARTAHSKIGNSLRSLPHSIRSGACRNHFSCFGWRLLRMFFPIQYIIWGHILSRCLFIFLPLYVGDGGHQRIYCHHHLVFSSKICFAHLSFGNRVVWPAHLQKHLFKSKKRRRRNDNNSLRQ